MLYSKRKIAWNRFQRHEPLSFLKPILFLFFIFIILTIARNWRNPTWQSPIVISNGICEGRKKKNNDAVETKICYFLQFIYFDISSYWVVFASYFATITEYLLNHAWCSVFTFTDRIRIVALISEYLCCGCTFSKIFIADKIRLIRQTSWTSLARNDMRY